MILDRRDLHIVQMILDDGDRIGAGDPSARCILRLTSGIDPAGRCDGVPKVGARR